MLARAPLLNALLTDFPVCLAQCPGNRFLTSTLVSALYQSPSDAQVLNDDHAAIVTALGAGDTLRAAELLRAHIDTLAARLNETRSGLRTDRDRLREALAPRGTAGAGAGAGAGRAAGKAVRKTS